MTIAIKHGGNIDDRRKQALAAAKRKRESGAGGKRHERHDRLSIRRQRQMCIRDSLQTVQKLLGSCALSQDG